MGNFLPTDYSPPTSVGNWMKLQPGSNRFRILGSFADDPKTAIMGFEAWEDEPRKPVRFRMADCPPKGAFPENPKHFWAFTVYNVNLDAFQILEITQKSIIEELNRFFDDAEWGNPSGSDGYDLDIFRIGDGKDTKYQVTPKPRKPLPDEVIKLIRPVDLEKMFTGDDPFEFALKSESEEEGPGF